MATTPEPEPLPRAPKALPEILDRCPNEPITVTLARYRRPIRDGECGGKAKPRLDGGDQPGP